MKIHIFEDSFVPKLLSIFIEINAITIGPLVFCRGKATGTLIRHESIHALQYRELWFVGFLVLYVWFWLTRLARCRDFRQAYLDIPFEQEARYGEADSNYLYSRQRFAWKAWLKPSPPSRW